MVDFSVVHISYSVSCISEFKLGTNDEQGPSGQYLADFVGTPRGLWLLVEGIHTEIWAVSATKILAEIRGNFQIGVNMKGKFP